MPIFIQIILATTLISLISLVGAILLFKKIAELHTSISLLVSLAAGVMLGATFFNILPEAFEELPIDTVLLGVLAGIVLSFLMERFLLWYHHHHEDTHSIKPSAYLVLFGDTIHNFVDGVAIAAAFLVNPSIGITATIAIAAHEIPQEFADFSILINAGIKKKKALFYNFLTALSAIAGAIVGYWLLTQFTLLTPIALSVTAGMFIYIALADLVPDLHREETSYLNISQSLPFIFGIFLMMMIISLTPDHHVEKETEVNGNSAHEDIHNPK